MSAVGLPRPLGLKFISTAFAASDFEQRLAADVPISTVGKSMLEAIRNGSAVPLIFIFARCGLSSAPADTVLC